MTPKEFKNWMKQMDYSVPKAAAALDLSQRQVSYYRSGESSIPKVVALACAYLKLQKEKPQ